MPGTIQVSILELSGLPSVSPSSSISIKVSVGKRQLDTQEKEILSLPLTTLRDNLIVEIQDAEGNEIARSCVETRLIVEKGFWDDLFPFEGGGHLHMRLLFILSEEERNRIRVVRESALRKKQVEPLKKQDKCLETSAPSDDSQKNIHQINSEDKGHADDQTVKISADSSPEIFSDPHFDPTEQVAPVKSHADTWDDTSYSEASSQFKSPTSTGAVDQLSVSSQVTEEIQYINPKKQDPLDNTSSNVRKMIIAFESSPAQKQEMTPHINPRTAKPQLSRMTMGFPLEGPILKSTGTVSENAKPIKPHVGRVLDSSVAKRMKKDPTYTGREEERIGICGASYIEKSCHIYKESRVESSDESSREKNELEIFVKVEDSNEEKGPHDDLPCTSKTNELLWSLGHELSGESRPSNMLIKEQGSSDISVIKEYDKGNHLDLSQDRKRSSEMPRGREQYYSHGFRGWIFLDETWCSCVVTGGKLVTDLLEGWPSHMSSETCPSKKGNKIYSGLKESEPENMVNVGSSKGPVGQALKIAIMIGFGILVFLTRKNKSR
ncbi:hypothetical protein Nepgr_005911 [Nepenthes gracilis]|uniref:Uncharacterized protein n=1 Tax=Nepenthes gracilis TaxID=150966 RepID=A0AAD3S418_NEPGR|nr:hypothetical protein Nepgr_005911 [Nepenthes gracilis]